MEKKPIHFTVSIIGRASGQTAVASAAYRSGSKLYCEYEDTVKDYSRKNHVTYSEIFLPANAPPEYMDREALWNAVDSLEKGKRAQLSRQIEFSLPCEIPREEQIEAARRMANYFREQGMAVDLNIHEPDYENPNPHCHLMLTMRPFEKDGSFVKYKSRREYILDENGEKIPLKNGKDFKSRRVNINDWDDRGNVEKWRQIWSRIETNAYRRNGVEIFAEHRSFKRQGIDVLPTVHMGPAVTAMERRGIRTEIGNLNREIRSYNQMLKEAQVELERLELWREELLKLRAEAEQAEREEKEKDHSVIGLLTEWQTNRENYLRDEEIYARTSTKTDNLREYSSMIAYLENQDIQSVDELLEHIEKRKSARRDAVHKYNDASRTVKELANLADLVKLYEPYRADVKKYESLKGRERERFLRKHPEVETGESYRNAIRSISKSEKYTTKKWRSELESAKQMRDKWRAAYKRTDEVIAQLSDILDKVVQVERSRQMEKGRLENRTGQQLHQSQRHKWRKNDAR